MDPIANFDSSKFMSSLNNTSALDSLPSIPSTSYSVTDPSKLRSNVSLALAILGVLLGVTATVIGSLSYANYQKASLPNAVTVTSAGFVGINDPAPLCQLSVGGGSLTDANVPVQISAHGSQGYFGVNRADGKYGLLMGYDTNSAGCVIRSYDPSDGIHIQVNNNVEALTILPSGFVGVGTKNPAYVLDVANTARFQNSVITNGVVATSELISAAGALSTTLDSIIDSRSASFTVTLGSGVNDQVKTVRLLYRMGFPVTVSCVNGGGGSFILTASDPCRVLRFVGTKWITDIGSTSSNVTSFYPSAQQGSKLVGTGATSGSQQGYAVAISADGGTIAVGANQDNGGAGAAWVFTLSGTTWTQQGPKMTGVGGTGNSAFGSSVALSADGNTLAVGGTQDNGGVGAVWIFTRSNSTWSQPIMKTGTGNSGNPNFGIVALSADGNTLAVGGASDNGNSGALWFFTRTNGTWTQQNNKVTGTGQMGQTITISADGNTVAAGGTTDNSNVGATWVWVRDSFSTGNWTQQGKLVGAGNTGGSNQGCAVSLSADGNLLAVGGWNDNSAQGGVWLWSRSYGSWSQQGSGRLFVNGTYKFGTSVTFSSDGNTLAVATASSTIYAYIFVRSGPNMVLQKTIAPSDGNLGSNMSYYLALNSAGNTLALGSYFDASQAGATWIFT